MTSDVDKILFNFIVVGGQRCGTGWLAQCLREHPEISMAKDESHFFTRNFEKGEKWWVDNYQHADAENGIIGEKCAEYLASEMAIDRIAAANPYIKILIIVRNPVDRYRSARLMSNRIQKGKVELQQLETRDFERGLFGKHCEKYVQRFGRENVLIVTYDKLIQTPRDSIEKIYAYLDVNSAFVPDSLHLRTKPGAMENKFPLLAKVSFLLLHRKSPFRKLYGHIRKLVVSETTYSEFDASLLEMYKPDILKLEKIMLEDLSIWTKGG